MVIYKIYKTREDIEYDYKNGKLKKDYIFAYDRRLYIVIDSNFTFYKPLNPIVFENNWQRDHIEKMCNLLWYDTDIVVSLDELEEVTKCCSQC